MIRAIAIAVVTLVATAVAAADNRVTTDRLVRIKY
jgi:hypothetical protein